MKPTEQKHTKSLLSDGPSAKDQADAMTARLALRNAAPELLTALILVNAHLEDLAKSNPGYIGKVVLQDYALMNEALLQSERALSKLGIAMPITPAAIAKAKGQG